MLFKNNVFFGKDVIRENNRIGMILEFGIFDKRWKREIRTVCRQIISFNSIHSIGKTETLLFYSFSGRDDSKNSDFCQ